MTKETFLTLNPETTLIIDIREKGEISFSGAIESAQNIPMMELAEKIYAEELDKNKMIVTVCQSGARCVAIKKLLTEHGYQSDYLEGGVGGLN